MIIKLFENFDEIDLDIMYEIYRIDKNGDEVEFGLEEDINPFDLREVFEYKMEHRNQYFNLIIKKVTKETLDDETIELLLNTKKYNI